MQCLKESKPCVGWVEKYFSDCLCNLNDEISFGFGFVSLICWGIAEIPQIITNFKAKSSHGVSLVFLLTWVAGDIFNLVGCLLEPATIVILYIMEYLLTNNFVLCFFFVLYGWLEKQLPTQYYTALLYTITTIVLVLQSFYYDYIYKWCKRRQKKINIEEAYEEEKQPLKPKQGLESGIPIRAGKNRTIPRREYYYGSARSMAGNLTPPSRAYMRVAKSGPSAMGLNDDSSSDDDESTQHPSTNSSTQPRPIPRFAGSYGSFLAASTLPLQSNAFLIGTKLLSQERGTHSALGQWLGWLMAAIYTGGRLPQIWLNMKRGSVEGLNPLMFIFALIANATYVGSILVRTTEWESIKANLPWLLDAIVCVALDLFIILQYAKYKYVRKTKSSDDGEYQDCKEATKITVS